MAPRDPLQRTPERFGSYNNVRSNPYSNSERILDVRNGILDPYTQIAQSTLQTSYNVDSLSAFGNTFRARILGVVEGKPARHLYPDLYANSTRAPEEVPSYFIFALRDESDQFAPDPSDYAASVAGYVNMIGLQGYAISEKPAAEIIESFGRGDIVEVYKPEQNSWNGALVKKVVVRNNFSEYVVRGTGAAAAFNNAGGQPFQGENNDRSGGVTLTEQYVPSGVIGPQIGIIPYDPSATGWAEFIGDPVPELAADKFGTTRHPIDPDEDTDATVRTDLVQILEAVKQEVNSLGGKFIAGSGGRNSVPGSRGFHPLGLALDLLNTIAATHREPDRHDPYLITFDQSLNPERWWRDGPGDPVPREAIVWAKSYIPPISLLA